MPQNGGMPAERIVLTGFSAGAIFTSALVLRFESTPARFETMLFAHLSVRNKAGQDCLDCINGSARCLESDLKGEVRFSTDAKKREKLRNSLEARVGIDHLSC